MNLQDEIKRIAPKATTREHKETLYFSVVYHCVVNKKPYIMCIEDEQPQFVDMVTGINMRGTQLKEPTLMAVRDIDFAVKVRDQAAKDMIRQRKEAELDADKKTFDRMDKVLDHSTQVAHLVWVDSEQMGKMQQDDKLLKEWASGINDNLTDFLGEKRQKCQTLFVIDEMFGKPDY